MPEITYKPADAARRLDMSSTTVRNWCRRYATHVSPAANPDSGEERQLTPRDIWVLEFVKTELAAGRTHADIEAMLSETTIPTIDELPESAQDAQEEPDTALALRQVFEDAIANVSASAARIESDISDIDKRLADVERNRFDIRSVLIGIAIGIGGIVAAALLLSLFIR